MLVYGDLLFVLNALVDYALLYVAGRAAQAPVRHGRLAAAAALGGLYACVEPLRLIPWAYGPAGVIAASLALVAVAYGTPPWRQTLRLLACFYGAAAALAGAVFALAFARSAGPLPWWAIGVPVAGALVAARRLGSVARSRWRAAPQSLIPVTVAIGGAQTRLLALVDTGNRLRDPVGQGPVLVVEARALAGVLPAALTAATRGGDPRWEHVVAALEGSPWAQRLRLIPYRSLGARSGVMIGFRPDRTEVAGRAAPSTVGLSGAPLDPDGRFQALCPAVLLQGAASGRVAAAAGAEAS